MWNVERTGYELPAKGVSDANGMVEVQYPYCANTKEHVLTTQLTLSVDHPDYVFESYHDVNVPYEADEPHQIELKPGVTFEIEPIENGKPAGLEDLHCIWSDGRSWLSDLKPTLSPNGTLIIPPLPEGKNQVMVVRLEGEHATHFSRIETVEGKAGETVKCRLELLPAVRVTGRLSDDVRRPIHHGRVCVSSLPANHHIHSVEWGTWAAISEDGTFVIERWPRTEAMQVIALADGYVARSGSPPAGIEPRDPDFYDRPQVFLGEQLSQELLVEMEPMVKCEIDVVDHREQSVLGAIINSYPNVGWWNSGSQIYCATLARSERMILTKDFFSFLEKNGPEPFEAVTDSKGHATMFLPEGKEDLRVSHEHFELPVNRGSREQEVTLKQGETTHARLELQPKGQEFLGEWDKLAGVLFGCTGEECRRLLADDGFRNRIEKVREQYSESDDPTDPALLTNAYSMISDAFQELGDKEEARLWQRKAKEQAKKIEGE
ncbi:hypothetical protein [Bythopirellula polymerisocia]|uniref:Uncharacterized protein n=1 Tax=Bythopirellula polymerisocia TaxID=2528003 RepID=A0A5C6D338_9BACT|nr:hypothetical protein [Bythopirellula polymerisocia]TWU30191.1 hypothetical protein Pla144_09770 [Bythopirellula polymerisocia]